MTNNNQIAFYFNEIQLIHRAGISNVLLYKIKKFEKLKNLSLKYCYSYTDFDGSFYIGYWTKESNNNQVQELKYFDGCNILCTKLIIVGIKWKKGKNGHYVIMITIELQFLANKAFSDSLADLLLFSFMYLSIRFYFESNKLDNS